MTLTTITPTSSVKFTVQTYIYLFPYLNNQFHHIHTNINPYNTEYAWTITISLSKGFKIIMDIYGEFQKILITILTNVMYHLSVWRHDQKYQKRIILYLPNFTIKFPIILDNDYLVSVYEKYPTYYNLKKFLNPQIIICQNLVPTLQLSQPTLQPNPTHIIWTYTHGYSYCRKKNRVSLIMVRMESSPQIVTMISRM